MNKKLIQLGETLWYDDGHGNPTECIVDAVEPVRVWVKLKDTKHRVYFENHELGRLRSKK